MAIHLGGGAATSQYSRHDWFDMDCHFPLAYVNQVCKMNLENCFMPCLHPKEEEGLLQQQQQHIINAAAVQWLEHPLRRRGFNFYVESFQRS